MAIEKPDLQRLGIFKELSYHTIGDPYVPFNANLISRAPASKNLPPLYLAGGYGKTKAANSDGYFHPFTSINVGDGGMNYADIQKAYQRSQKAKFLTPTGWIPSSGRKLRCGTGSYSGNFQEIYEALDPAVHAKTRVPQQKNFYTNPGKKGTGYGYPHVCLNPFPTWQAGDTMSGAAHRIFVEETAKHTAKSLGRQPFVSTCRSTEEFDVNPWQHGDPLAPGGPPVMNIGIQAFPKSMQIGPAFVPSHPARWDGGMKDGTLNKFPEYSHEPYTEPLAVLRETKTKLLSGEWIPNPSTAVNTPQPSVVNKNISLRINPKTNKTRLKVWDLC